MVAAGYDPNAFISFFDKADGESIQKGKEKWIEIDSWNWEVQAESSWTKGGGASVGKPNPGKISFDHFFDSASTVLLGYICTGKAFPKVELQMTKTTGRGTPETYFTMRMEGVFITKVFNSGNQEGIAMQQVEMVFKIVSIEYKAQDNKTGLLNNVKNFNWDIPAGTASPSA
jgi:type VI secretion system Hcp family effector